MFQKKIQLWVCATRNMCSYKVINQDFLPNCHDFPRIILTWMSWFSQIFSLKVLFLQGFLVWLSRYSLKLAWMSWFLRVWVWLSSFSQMFGLTVLTFRHFWPDCPDFPISWKISPIKITIIYCLQLGNTRTCNLVEPQASPLSETSSKLHICTVSLQYVFSHVQLMVGSFKRLATHATFIRSLSSFVTVVYCFTMPIHLPSLFRIVVSSICGWYTRGCGGSKDCVLIITEW